MDDRRSDTLVFAPAWNEETSRSGGIPEYWPTPRIPPAWNIDPAGELRWEAITRAQYLWGMFRRSRVGAVVVLALVSSATAVLPAAAKTNRPAVTHKLIMVVKKNRTPAAEKKLAVLVLVSQNGAPAGAVATSSKPLTVQLNNRGFYRVKAEIDSSCKGSCDASYRISGSANHELEVVPTCHLNGSVFVCSKVTIVRIY
jgi:hypothetical protein